jgi:outer membrane protein OmpA-like peptidoglycan-associated protein
MKDDKNKFNLSKNEDEPKDKSKFNLSKNNEPSGNLVSEKKSSPDLKKTDDKKKSKAWIFILLAVAVIVVVILVIMNNNKTSTKTADNNTASTETKDTAGAKTTADNTDQTTPVVKDDAGTNNKTAANSSLQKYVKGTSYEVYHFASGSPQISGTDPNLDEMFTYLKENPKASVQITGYTDNVGSEELNLNLSKQRASAVFNYLVAKGIDAGRMKYSGKGLVNPVADNSTEEGRLKNRRAEFEITN